MRRNIRVFSVANKLTARSFFPCEKSYHRPRSSRARSFSACPRPPANHGQEGKAEEVEARCRGAVRCSSLQGAASDLARFSRMSECAWRNAIRKLREEETWRGVRRTYISKNLCNTIGNVMTCDALSEPGHSVRPHARARGRSHR